MGYSEDRIKELYFSRPNVPFEESLMPIQTDKEVREVIRLCSEHEFVSIYVEHNDDVNDKGKNVLSNEGGDENSDSGVGEEEYFLDVDEESDHYDDDDWFNSDDDDPKLKEIRDKKGAAKEAIDAELEVLKANVVDEVGNSMTKVGLNIIRILIMPTVQLMTVGQIMMMILLLRREREK